MQDALPYFAEDTIKPPGDGAARGASAQVCRTHGGADFRHYRLVG